ncbi:MAG TPA: hypothetical protein DEG71_02195 [Clostridiales bacterium]|nr:hypothetical protein [Clostridiales bacterium]
MLVRGVWGICKNGEIKFIEITENAEPEYSGRIIIEGLIMMKKIYEKEYIERLKQIFDLLEYRPDIISNSNIFDIMKRYISNNNRTILIKEPQVVSGEEKYSEWSHIINLDKDTFEVYRGLKYKRDNAGKLILKRPKGKYYDIKIYGRVFFDKLKG